MALFEDRVEAAKQLARKVQQWLDNKNKIMAIEIKEGQEKEQQKPNNKDDTIVLAIPRGGVIVGDVIVSMHNNFEGKTVVLVDDGVATAPPSPPISLESSSNKDIV